MHFVAAQLDTKRAGDGCRLFGCLSHLKALTAIHQVAEPMAHHHADSQAHGDGPMHHADSSRTAPANDDTSVSCAACASCHMSGAIPSRMIVSADIPVADATTFADTEVPRARNVASGLERPPRT